MEGEGIVSTCSVCTENFLSSGIKITSAISVFFNQPLILQILPLKEHISHSPSFTSTLEGKNQKKYIINMRHFGFP